MKAGGPAPGVRGGQEGLRTFMGIICFRRFSALPWRDRLHYENNHRDHLQLETLAIHKTIVRTEGDLHQVRKVTLRRREDIRKGNYMELDERRDEMRQEESKGKEEMWDKEGEGRRGEDETRQTGRKDNARREDKTRQDKTRQDKTRQEKRREEKRREEKRREEKRREEKRRCWS